MGGGGRSRLTHCLQGPEVAGTSLGGTVPLAGSLKGGKGSLALGISQPVSCSPFSFCSLPQQASSLTTISQIHRTGDPESLVQAAAKAKTR